jgi:pyruvate dehydrogenase E1 component alpha subunit
MGPHTTADDPTRYRDAAEVEAWRLRDPIARFRTHLQDLGVLTAEDDERVAAKAESVAEALRAGCVALADPGPLTLFDHVYAEPHSGLERQRRRYSRYLEAFSDEGPVR